MNYRTINSIQYAMDEVIAAANAIKLAQRNSPKTFDESVNFTNIHKAKILLMREKNKITGGAAASD